MLRRSTVGTLIYLLAGPLTWGLHFTVIYGAQSTLCAVGGAPDRAVALVMAIATITALALLAGIVARPDHVAAALGAGDWAPPVRLFQRRVMVLLAILSAFGIAGAGLAATFLPACAALH